ncbi:FG-GAP-like repeat-containing protein [Bradyrhizobium sp. HKCCYLRH3061]|uniref:FG-GAP-like repeat-containing protein n=1 Tax=Bradyrhizobium sp. HKCCYLRH3061 TaxID=3420734 RepID=UPI003EB8B301
MTLPGSFSVSQSGSATYSVPISMPPGSAGVVPALSLDYNSQAGNGLLGVGWFLGGLPSIGRCPQTRAQDGGVRGIAFDAGDRFCMEGERLVAVSGTYGANGTEYRTELEGYSKIISHGTAGTGPAWFEVRTKSGQVMEFGNTADSMSLAQGKSSARAWALNKISDTKGNYLTVTYTNDAANGQVYPSRIDYTGNANANVAPYNSVQFVYTTRSDPFAGYEAGSVVRTTVLMTNVRTFTGSTQIADYRLTYGQSAATSRSRLASVQVCDSSSSSASCLPATTFGWQLGESTFQAPIGGNPSTGAGQINSWNWGQGYYISTSGDVNGDGKGDAVLVAPTASGLYVYSLIGTGSGTFNLVGGNQSNGSGTINNWNWGTGMYTTGLADLNGDGKLDVILVAPTSSGLYVYSLLGNGDGTFSLVGGNPSTGAGQINNWNWSGGYVSICNDLNGDGRSDIVLIASTTSGLYAYSLMGNGNGTFNLVGGNASTGAGQINNWNWGGSGVYQSSGADVNGDGRGDVLLVAPTTGGLYAYSLIGNGDGTFSLVGGSPSKDGSGTINTWNWSSGVYMVMSADINGDGKTDSVLVAPTTNGLYVYSLIGDGSGSFNLAGGNLSTGAGQINSWNWTGGYTPGLGDINADGKVDLTMVAPTVNGLFSYVLTGRGDGTFNLIGGNGVDGSGTMNTWNWSGGYSPMGSELNGDGKSDVVLVMPTPNGLYVYSLLAAAGYPDLITTITGGLGTTTTVTYLPLTNSSVYTKDTGSSYPLIDLQSAAHVVSRVDASNGIGGTYSSTYTYVGAKSDITGRGMLGFRQMTVKDLQTGIADTTTFRQDFPYIGMVASTTRTLGTQTLGQSTNTFQFSNAAGTTTISPSGAPYRVLLAQNVSSGSDLDGSVLPTVTTANQYDAYGNATRVAVSTPDGYSKTTVNTYTNDPSLWYLGRLTRASVTSVAP